MKNGGKNPAVLFVTFNEYAHHTYATIWKYFLAHNITFSHSSKLWYPQQECTFPAKTMPIALLLVVLAGPFHCANTVRYVPNLPQLRCLVGSLPLGQMDTNAHLQLWYPQQESNLYQGFRKPLFYPVELWGHTTIFYSFILILQVAFPPCIIPPKKGRVSWEAD